MEREVIVGIDLGTTNSLVGAFTAEGPVLFPNAMGGFLTPSVVSIGDDGAVLVGQAAQERLQTHPHVTVAAFKRWMGTSRELALGEKRFRPEELSALVLRSLMDDAQAACGEKISEAVISVPAYFSDAQRKATRAAGELAGIRVERLINEPTAAALAYGLGEKKDGGRFLVLDLGGGTFDVSILEIFEGVFQVHASAGDNFLGGEDFLNLLVAAFLQENGLQSSSLSTSDLGRLRQRLERVKHDLTLEDGSSMEMVLEDRTYQWSLTRERFNRMCEPLVHRMRAPVERAIRDARLQAQDLDEVVLVGGASRMQLVSLLVSRMLGLLPMRHINPDHVVGLGAAVAAGMKRREQQLDEVILTDICPYTLGIDIAQPSTFGKGYIPGLFLPIIPRNSTVPISREEYVEPIEAAQDKIRVGIYQGESPTVDKNIKLGEVTVRIPKGNVNRGASVRFTYDVNGLLQVEVKVAASGLTKELVLEHNSGVLSADEIRRRLEMLNGLKIHPREQQENMVLLARANRIYEEYIDRRDEIQHWMAGFKSALESQDEAIIRDIRDKFMQVLNFMEEDA